MEYAGQGEIFGITKVIAFDSKFKEFWDYVMTGYVVWV